MKEAKHYSQRLMYRLQQLDSRGVWRGERDITNYKPMHIHTHTTRANASLADELNKFFAHLESGNSHCAPIWRGDTHYNGT